jgi:hypothetical protein
MARAVRGTVATKSARSRKNAPNVFIDAQNETRWRCCISDAQLKPHSFPYALGIFLEKGPQQRGQNIEQVIHNRFDQ